MPETPVTPMNLLTATPAEIDAVLAHLWGTEERHADIAQRYLGHAERERFEYRADEYRQKAEDHRALAAEARTEALPYEAEFSRRGGWSRFFLVQNTGGHVHSSMDCTTCFADTRFGWLIDLAGRTEAEMVAEFGETACTVCFPSAPTMRGFADGTSALARFSAAEKAERAEAKAARAAAKAAKALVAPVRVRGQRFETVASALQGIRDAADDDVYYGQVGDFAAERAEIRRVLTEALLEKGMAQSEIDTAAAKAAAKARKAMASWAPAQRSYPPLARPAGPVRGGSPTRGAEPQEGGTRRRTSAASGRGSGTGSA